MVAKNKPRWPTTRKSAVGPPIFPCSAWKGTRRIVGRGVTILAPPTFRPSRFPCWSAPSPGCPTHPRSAGAGRRRLFRPQNCRIYRGQTGFLCDRGSAHSATEKSPVGIALPPGRAGSGGGGIPVLSSGVARAATLRGHPSPRAGRTFGTVDPVPEGRLQLPSFGHQPRFAAPQPLALLQSARSGGIDHPRTEVCLCAGEDSHQRLPDQRGVLPDCIAGLQLAELVQTSLRPTAPAASYPAASSPAVVRGAVSVGATGRGPDSASCPELPLDRRLPGNAAAHTANSPPF